MERPILDWLNELEEPYKSKAIANYNTPKAKKWRERCGYIIAESKSDAIIRAFPWSKTPEEKVFWCDYYESL